MWKQEYKLNEHRSTNNTNTNSTNNSKNTNRRRTNRMWLLLVNTYVYGPNPFYEIVFYIKWLLSICRVRVKSDSWKPASSWSNSADFSNCVKYVFCSRAVFLLTLLFVFLLRSFSSFVLYLLRIFLFRFLPPPIFVALMFGPLDLFLFRRSWSLGLTTPRSLPRFVSRARKQELAAVGAEKWLLLLWSVGSLRHFLPQRERKVFLFN